MGALGLARIMCRVGSHGDGCTTQRRHVVILQYLGTC